MEGMHVSCHSNRAIDILRRGTATKIYTILQKRISRASALLSSRDRHARDFRTNCRNSGKPTAMLLLFVQWDENEEERLLLGSRSAFNAKDSKKTGDCCATCSALSGYYFDGNLSLLCFLFSVQQNKCQEDRHSCASSSAFRGTNSKKTGHYCALTQHSVGQIPRRLVTAVLPLQHSEGQIPRRPITTVLLLSTQWDKFKEDQSLLFFLLSVQRDNFQKGRSLLCSCSALSGTNSKKSGLCCSSTSAFSGTNSKKTGHCCALAQRSVVQIPRRQITDVTTVLLLSSQWDKFQEVRSLLCFLLNIQRDKFQEQRSMLCSCPAFSWTNSKKTGHCCAPAQRSVGQFPRTPVTIVVLLIVQWDKFEEDRSLLCSCSAFRRTNSKKSGHCCALAQHSVGQIPRRPVADVLLLSVQWDKFQNDRSLLYSCSAFSGTNSKKTGQCCPLAQHSVGQIPTRAVTVALLFIVQLDKVQKRLVNDVLLLSVQSDTFLEDRSLLCFCPAVSRTNSKKTSHCCASFSAFRGTNFKKTGHCCSSSSAFSWTNSKNSGHSCALAQRSVGYIPKRPATAVLLLSIQWDKFQEHRSMLCSCSAFSGTNSKKTGHCWAPAQRSVGQIPRTPFTVVLLLSVQWDTFQEERSLLYSCSAFSWTKSKKTDHCCALAQR